LTPKNSKKKNGFTVNEPTCVGRNAPSLGTPPLETGGVRKRGGFHPTSQLQTVESVTQADSTLQEH